MIKKIISLIFILSFSVENDAQSTPFHKGINLTNWFQVNSAKQIQFTRYTKSDLEDIKSLGVDVIRLPINLHNMVINNDNYKLDPLFLKFLDEIIDWTEELEIHLILDNHSFDPNVSTEPDIKDVLIPVWQNMAMHFKDRSELIYFEILNEPHGISDEIWNAIQGEVINAIREIDTIHTIIVGPSGYNSYNNLNAMPTYEDDNLIYTFHFYDPFLFTHQGASWTEPSMVSLANIPFPYNIAEMPSFPADLAGTWIQSSFNNYNIDGTIGKVRELIDIAINFRDERGVPLFCGEFGVLMNNVDNNDRILWYNIVRTYFEFKGIPWTTWDYHGGFGLFNQFGKDLFDHDLNVKLLESLGFNVPFQTEFILIPDTSGFTLYSDYIGKNIVNSSYSDGVLDFYSSISIKGNYSIFWDSPSQYNSIGFRFHPIKDLSVLIDENYQLGFWLKAESNTAKFDIRFIDTKTSPEDHPWRMGFTIDLTNYSLDTNWQYIRIPLSSFNEYGSWDNETWFNPIGLFDWSSLDRLEIVNEHNSLNNTKIWFDEISLFDPRITEVKGESISHIYELFQNYPNPFNVSTTINYFIPYDGHIELHVYDILGTEIIELENEISKAGKHSVYFDASKYASGVYYYVMKFNDNIQAKQMLLLK